MELLGPSPSRLKLEQTPREPIRMDHLLNDHRRPKVVNEGNLLWILQRFGHLSVNSNSVDEQRFGFGEEFNQTGHLLEEETPPVLMKER